VFNILELQLTSIREVIEGASFKRSLPRNYRKILKTLSRFEEKLKKVCNKFRLPIESVYISKISQVISSKIGHFPSYHCLVIRHKLESSSLTEREREKG